MTQSPRERVEIFPRQRDYWLKLIRDIVLWAVVGSILTALFSFVLLPQVKKIVAELVGLNWKETPLDAHFSRACEYRWTTAQFELDSGDLRGKGPYLFHPTVITDTRLVSEDGGAAFFINSDAKDKMFGAFGVLGSVTLEQRCP